MLLLFRVLRVHRNYQYKIGIVCLSYDPERLRKDKLNIEPPHSLLPLQFNIQLQRSTFLSSGLFCRLFRNINRNFIALCPFLTEKYWKIRGFYFYFSITPKINFFVLWVILPFISLLLYRQTSSTKGFFQRFQSVALMSVETLSYKVMFSLKYSNC